ncbi:GntR family transcriptional regulator [Pengzhenrongella sp.]|jgi:DNA-binding GntR family transcriptional regulator|uniref:GntR family transcriptional regulator n=1 Tax=Pengzhenrongella sp. TaxID=2888820 RepID=UPI002F92597C
MPLPEYRVPLKRPPLRFEAYDVLLDAIIRGELAPGEQIRDTDVAARLGLSRTPVREAISRLVDVGLAESKPGVYTRITILDRRDVLATLKVLRALDDIAVRDGVPAMTPDHLERLREANENFAKAVRGTDVMQAIVTDDLFHAIIVEAAENPVVARLIEQLHPQIHRILFRKFSSLLGSRETVDHHEQLIALCAAGDADAAAALSAEHWSHLGVLIDDLFESDHLVR